MPNLFLPTYATESLEKYLKKLYRMAVLFACFFESHVKSTAKKGNILRVKYYLLASILRVWFGFCQLLSFMEALIAVGISLCIGFSPVGRIPAVKLFIKAMTGG